MVGLRSSSDPVHRPASHRDLSLLGRRPVDHRTGHALFEVVDLPLPADSLASVPGHPFRDPILARLFGVLNICLLVLWLGNRDWLNKSPLRNHVEPVDDGVIVIFFVRLGLCLVLVLDRRARGGGGRPGLLSSSI